MQHNIGNISTKDLMRTIKATKQNSELNSVVAPPPPPPLASDYVRRIAVLVVSNIVFVS